MNLVRLSITAKSHLPAPNILKNTSSQCHLYPTKGRMARENPHSRLEYSSIQRWTVDRCTLMPSPSRTYATFWADRPETYSRRARAITLEL